MNYKTLMLQLFLLASFQAYGMESNNNEESGLITTLPEEILEQIVIYNLMQKNRDVSAIPCVCKTWNKIANSAQVIKQIAAINPAKIARMSGYRYYLKINKQLFDSCYTEELNLEKIKKIIEDPYININKNSLDSKTQLTIPPIFVAAKHSKPELVKLLLNQKPDLTIGFYMDLLLPYTLSALSENKIQSAIECFALLCNAGAKDDGYALNEAIRLARTNALYYQTIPLFKNTDTDSNYQSDYHKTRPLHILLDSAYNVAPDIETLIILMRDYNANPHLKDIYNRTAYTLAKKFDDKYKNTNYLEIVKKYDKGLEWYEKNPKGCYQENV